MVWFLCLRLQKSSFERVMDLTDSFTWEDLPTRDDDTGHLTAAGWIPLTMNYSVRVAIAGLCVHIVQSTIRIVTNHETVFNAWYPFDWTVSPFYELVNIAQVTITKTEFSLISPYTTLKLTLCVDIFLYTFLFLHIFFLTYFPPEVFRIHDLVSWLIKIKMKIFSIRHTLSNSDVKP